MTRASNERFDRYARWVDRWRSALLATGGLVIALGALLARGLPLRADLSSLLPPQERSVREIELIERRTHNLGLVLCVVASDDPELRAKGARAVVDRLRKLGPELIASVVADDSLARRFAWDNRFLFAPLADIREARDALKARLSEAKLRANPLYVPLGEETTEAPLDSLRQRMKDAQQRTNQAEAIVSRDHRVQLVIIQAPFPSSSVTQGERLVAALTDLLAELRREVGPAVQIGITEDVVIAVAEHRAVLDGMSLAVVLTLLVVGLSLFLYYRSWPALWALFGSLAVGTLATFGVARLTIGHLNSVSAFLSSIVVGNGINFPILVLARHFEERRRGVPAQRALEIALRGSFPGTVTAALAAGVAYAALIVTDFRGFRDFGVIGGVGMLLCWASAYTVLPAALATLERRGLVRVRPELRVGPLVASLLPRRSGVILTGAVALVAGAALVTFRFLSGDPFEYDWQQMRSDSVVARDARAWMARVDQAFGRQLVGGFVVAADRLEDAATVERLLRARAEDEPGVRPAEALFRQVSSVGDMLPRDQAAKLGALAEIRELLDERNLSLLDEDDVADARRLRPPDGLRALTAADLPEPLARRFIERDGSVGRLIFANQASRFDGWNGRDMIAFAKAVRALDLPPRTTIAGGAFVFADIIHAVVRAGPRATLAAIVGVTVFVLIVLGPGRHAVVTLVCVACGSTLMIAGAALLGLRVNFLDFVALPITLGIGVDYAVNLVVRERSEGPGSARQALATTGGAVVLCSWTTMVGYGSLLLSANAGIRSFGLTAILGEATCLVTALTLAPALLTRFAPGTATPRVRGPGSAR